MGRKRRWTSLKQDPVKTKRRWTSLMHDLQLFPTPRARGKDCPNPFVNSPSPDDGEIGDVEEKNSREMGRVRAAWSAKGPAFIVERIELLDLGVDQSFNVPTISSGWLAGSGWGISTMDWLGQSQYLRQTVFWPSLSSAVSELLKQVIFSKHALVNMLVTYWSHFLDGTDEYLKSILYSTILCHSSSRNNCKGRVNIKYYIVPGYKKTGAAKSNKDRCADDKLKKMALRVIAESLSEEEIAGLKEAIPCDPPFEIPEGPSYTCRGRRRHF
ncbi:hypothetical protein ZIOFF_035463 [Zingiber officinale]|uniref:Uncharacterized protein n=2 Tax=Zingiber officinale TaxID=94328 RepID=A0A8J5GGZ5_ZINOF|nr:hypothetical protein ZIOFF_035463 [Zingiber officinale]